MVDVTPDDLAAANSIEFFREVRGMPKAELARRAGISRRTLSYYLAGENAMTLGTYRTLCAELGVSRQEAASRQAIELDALDDTTE